MLRVRFPNGQAIRYNNANEVRFNAAEGILELIQRSGTQMYWLAKIPATTNCIIESVDPCVVENPISDLTPQKAAEFLLKSIRQVPEYRLAEIKAALTGFDSKRKAWKS